nr:hypothetical protein [Tanacetum cinerariifolium]
MQTQTLNTLYNAIMEAGGKDRPPMLAPAIERLKQGKSINVQDLKSNLNWEFGKFTSRDGESLKSYYSRFYQMIYELFRNQCDVTNHQVNVQFLLQLQPEWQRFVTLVKQSQELKTVSYHKLYDILKQHQNKVNEIRAKRLAHTANPLALVAQQQPVYHPQNHPTHYTQYYSTRSQQAATRNRGKAIVNYPPPIYDQEPTMVTEDDEIANKDNSPRINKGTGNDNQRIVNVAGARENVGTPVVQQSRIQCYNCKEYGHVELEAHYMYMAQIQEVTPDAVDSSGPIFDSEPLQKDDDDDDLTNERDLLASLIEKLKCEIDDSKNLNKFLETSNKALVDKLKGEIEDFKTKNKSLESSNNHFKEANNELSKTNQLIFKDLKKFQAELDRYHDVKINADLEKFHLCLKEEMVADLRCFNSLELKVDSLKSQLETQKTQFLNEIDRLSREYYYADHMNAILGVYTELDEVTNLQCDYLKTLEKCECLEKELSKSKIMPNSFEALQKHAINLELDLHQYLKAQLQDKGIAISELKKLIEKLKGKSVETKFEKSSVIRPPNAFESQRPSIFRKPTIFSNSLDKKDFSKSKSVTKNNVSNDFSKPVTAQILPPTNKSIVKNTNVITLGMYKLHTEPIQTRTTQLPHDIRKTNKRMSFSTGVIPFTSVSRPQLKSNQMEDRVMLNNSQGKKQEVEDHRWNVKFSNNKMS